MLPAECIVGDAKQCIVGDAKPSTLLKLLPTPCNERLVLHCLWGVLCLLVVATSPAASQDVHIRELGRTGNSVTLEIALPAPSFDTTAAGTLLIRPYTSQERNG